MITLLVYFHLCILNLLYPSTNWLGAAVSMKLKNYRNTSDMVESRRWNYYFCWLFTFVRLGRSSFFRKAVYFRGVACPASFFFFLISFSRNKAVFDSETKTEMGPLLRCALHRYIFHRAFWALPVLLLTASWMPYLRQVPLSQLLLNGIAGSAEKWGKCDRPGSST